MTFIIQKIRNYSFVTKEISNTVLRSVIQKILYFGLIILFCAFLDLFSTKSLLILIAMAFVIYLVMSERQNLQERMQIKKMFKDSALSKNKFDSALARELLSAQFKLNKLLDEADPVFKRAEHPGDEFCRKSFSHYLRAYEKYQDITAFVPYKTPDGRAAGLIVLLQRYSNTESNNEQKYYYFDPISELEDFNEETLIHLHSYGPIEYNHIEKLEVGDVIKAYVYDPEDFGFLEPHESTIKVISIDKPDDWERNISIEIIKKSSGDIMPDVQQKSAVRTLKHTTL